MTLLLGIDLGTSYFKVGLFDATGALKGLGRVAVEADRPAPNRSELPVPRFWALLRRGLAEALLQAGANPGEIAALSYSCQANSFVLLDSADEPLTPIVLWTDARAEPLAPDLEKFSRHEEFLRTVGFAGWSSGFAVAKWRWFQVNEPDLWARSRAALTLADYFTFAVTGERVGDASTAAFLGLYDLERRRWWPEALAAARIDASHLSQPLVPGAFVGRTSTRAAELLGLPAGMPFAVGGLDHHVAALGAGVGRVADVSISTGTVLAALTLVDRFVPMPGCYHGPHMDGRRFYRLAFAAEGAGQLEAYQREHAPDRSIAELIALAEGAYNAGQSSNTGTAALACGHGQAVLEFLRRVARMQRELVRQVTAGEPVRAVVATGGGARSAFWLQLMARELGLPLRAQPIPELACLGASMLAGVAAGVFRDSDEACRAMGGGHGTHAGDPP